MELQDRSGFEYHTNSPCDIQPVIATLADAEWRPPAYIYPDGSTFGLNAVGNVQPVDFQRHAYRDSHGVVHMDDVAGFRPGADDTFGKMLDFSRKLMKDM